MFSKNKIFLFTNHVKYSKAMYKFNKRFFIDFDPSKDYYKILGINPNSTEKDIKTAYYKLAKQYHPDLNKGKSTDSFKEMSAAYDILSDKDKKKQYDEYRNTINNEHNQRYNSFYDAFRGHQKRENQSHQNNQNSQNNYGFNKEYNRTTYTYRDPNTGEYKTYTYQSNTHDNPFLKDFEDYMKNFQKNWKPNDNFNFKKNQSSDHQNSWNRNKDDFDPNHIFRDNFSGRKKTYQHDWEPRWQQDFYSYMYAKKLFTYIMLGTMFLFLLTIRGRRQNDSYYLDLPETPQYKSITPNAHNNERYYPTYNSGVIPPQYNSSLHFDIRDPYLNPYINPKIK